MTHSHSPDRRLFLKGTAAAFASCVTTTLVATEDEEGPFFIQPYLQNPTADGMTICFASIDAEDVHVRWGRAKGSLGGTAVMSSSSMTKVTWRVWKARLAKLQAGHTYFYRVEYREGGVRRSSEEYSFTPCDPHARDVHAVVYNDVHDRIATAEALVQWVKPEDFSFSILLGDMWNDPSLHNNARRTFMNLEAYVRLFDGSNKPMFFVRGNHDVRGWFASRLSNLFDFPLNDPASPLEEQNAFYDFRVGPVWFIAPDSGEDGSKQMALYQPYRQRQAKWLSEIVENSPHHDAAWRVLPTHIPLYYRGYWDAAHSRALWDDILARSKIDVSIAGHIHAHGLIPAGEEVVHVTKKGTPEETTIRYTPSFPTFIGGGPDLNSATVTFLSGDNQHLNLRAVNTRGEDVLQFALKK